MPHRDTSYMSIPNDGDDPTLSMPKKENKPSYQTNYIKIPNDGDDPL